jgi:uncharacterized protein YceH (UPF0502 family)
VDRYRPRRWGRVSPDALLGAGSEDRAAPRRGGLESRVEALEAELAELRRELDALRQGAH